MNRRFLLKSSILLLLPRMATAQVFMDMPIEMPGFRFPYLIEQDVIEKLNSGFPQRSIFFENQRLGFVNSIFKNRTQWMANVRIDNEFVELIQSGEIVFTPYKIAHINGEESSVVLGNFEGFRKEEFEIVKRLKHFIVTMW